MISILFVGKEPREEYRRCSLRFRHFLRCCAVNTFLYCDDEPIIESIKANEIVVFDSFDKSGINGAYKIMRMMNNDWSYTPEDKMVAWVVGKKLHLRMCHQTTSIKEKFDYPL